MKARRFEEVLEECLAAQLEGRRTIEESLSLYPWLASELEPLLRAAAILADTFERNSPPSYVLERGRDRFLVAASNRVRARALAARAGLGHRSQAWGLRLWGAVGSAAAATIVAVTVGVVALLSAGGTGGPAGSGTEPTGSAPAVLDLTSVQQAHQHLKEAAALGQRITFSDLAVLRDALERWSSVDPGTLSEETRQQLEQTVQEQIEILTTLSSAPSPATEPDEIMFVLGSTKDVAEKLGLVIPTFSPVATPAPATAEPTVPPAETPAPTLPPVPTPPPTTAPTEAPAPETEAAPTAPVFQPF